MKKIIQEFKNFLQLIKKERQKNAYIPLYRLLEILQDEDGTHTVHVQMIMKNLTFYAKPEEILADDSLVDLFSPRDIRSLTYLGYLGINSPKYTILAKRFIANNKIAFALKKRGEKEVVIKTADQILKEQEIISSMSPEDAKTIGYTVASEAAQDEKKLKEETLKLLNKKTKEKKKL